MKYKKSRVKQLQNGEEIITGNGELKMDDKKNMVQTKRKNGEKEKSPPNKKPKKENKKMSPIESNNDPIKRSDSPGMDLSVFEPRGKRKCVIQNELKKQRTDDWWSDEEEPEDGVKSENHRPKPDNNQEGEEDEVEEEIIDDDDDEQEIEIKDEDDNELLEEEEEIEDFDEDELIKPPVVQPVKPKRAAKKKAPTKESPSIKQEPPPPIEKKTVEKTVRCFVFSTAMANRAGHAVSKGLHSSISKYHDAQKWETPYLNAEVHCRPFNATLEDEFEKKQQQENSSSVVTAENGVHLNGVSSDSLKPKPETVTSGKERTLSVDSWQKEQVIQAAQRMGRAGKVNGQSVPQIDDLKPNPLHPRFHLLGGPPPPNNLHQFMETKNENDTPLHGCTDSDSSPQTVPKIEKTESECSSSHSPISIKTLSSLSSRNHRASPPLDNNDFTLRNKDLNSPPPQLVPSLPRTKEMMISELPARGENKEPVLSLPNKLAQSYPADVTNIKDQLRFHSPKEFNLQKLLSKPPPGILGAPGPRNIDNKCVRSTIDTAEKALIQSRMKTSPPILPRDVHPSAFQSPRDRDGHSRQSPFKGYTGGGITPNGNALFNPHLRPHSSFSPPAPASRHYQHPREAIENIVDFSRNSVIIPPPPVRPSVSRTNGYPDSKTFEDYKPLSSSSISSLHQRKDRPSSLPVSDIYAGSEKKVPPVRSSFSVETLTQSHGRNERIPDENSVARHIERRFPIPSHPHSFHERMSLPPSAHAPHELHERHGPPHERHGPPHERLHVPNGLSIHNGLKRTLDEQLSTNILREQAERDRKYYDQIREDWLRKDKERRIMEFDRLIPPRPQFPGPRSPLHVPVYLPPRGGPLNGQRGDLPSPPPHRLYSPYGRR